MQKVSVILTTFNGEASIEKTITSILTQTGIHERFELELIVIDDCSTDNTVHLLKQYPVRLFSTETNSGGPNKGRNIGLKNATGDYLCIADQDDVWEPHRVISLLPYLAQVPIVTSGYTLLDEYKNKTIKRAKENPSAHVRYDRNQTFLSKLNRDLSGQNTYLGSILYSRTLQSIRFEEHFGVVDYDWILRLFHQQESIEVCDALYVRFVNKNNLSLNDSYRRKDFYYSLYFIEQYQVTYPKETKRAYLKIHGSRARYYYLTGDMKQARFYFLRSKMNAVTLFYYLTTFVGHKWVKNHFNVFG